MNLTNSAHHKGSEVSICFSHQYNVGYSGLILKDHDRIWAGGKAVRVLDNMDSGTQTEQSWEAFPMTNQETGLSISKSLSSL